MAITKEWITSWAAQYPEDYDDRISDLRGKETATYGDVERIVRWKSARSVGYYRKNSRSQVERSIAEALTAREDGSALEALLALHGVGERVGSAILAILRPGRFTVMDRWAWRSLRAHERLEGFDAKSWRAVWVPYLNECRRIARRHKVTLRTVDRALYSARGDVGLPDI